MPTSTDKSCAVMANPPGEGLRLVRASGEHADDLGALQNEADLREWRWVVCFDAATLAAEWRDVWARLVAQGRALDGALLARILLPTEESHAVTDIAGALEVNPEGLSRACLDGQVAIRLLEVLARQPIAVLTNMERLLKPIGGALYECVSEAASAAVKNGFGAQQRDLLDLVPAQKVRHYKEQPEPVAPPVLLDTESVCNVFVRDGAVAACHPAYEQRPEQIRMVQEICEAFNDQLVLMVEAGTGTGKSMAYLAPAIVWAVQNNDPVIIATNTKNLQAQLFQKELPFLAKVLNGGFRYALIKGRANYLCLRKFLMVVDDADRELSEAERLEILPVLTWLPQTGAGDVSENTGFRPGMESELWAMISTRMGECVGSRCRWHDRCFVRRARARAFQADVIVANHAMVFMECSMDSPVLPEYRCIVFDEAHNLEDVATSCFATVVASWQAPRIIKRLFRGRRDGAGRGLFANLRFQLSRVGDALPEDATTRISEAIADAIRQFDWLRDAGRKLFGAVDSLFALSRGRREDRIRYDAAHRPDGWPQVAHAATEFKELIAAVAKRLDQIAQEVGRITGGDAPDDPLQSLAEVGIEIASGGALLRERIQALEIVSQAEDESFVYWAERGEGQVGPSLCAAPLDIAGLMNDAIYSRKRTVILTSATLSAGHSFDFMCDRLGMRGAVAERVRTAELGTSFDFKRQTFIGVPLFLPEPRAYGVDFVTPFSDLVVEVLKVTSGRGLVLFTSHRMLRQVNEMVRPALAAAGIPVLAQGVDGGRERLMALFERERRSVLLGTQSFWEGIDVPGQSLTCLIIAKLPFRPPTDPIVSARCELLQQQGRSDFAEYMLPDAVIRLKQGFGRLIRTRQDRGVALICDPRVATKGYGRVFRESLPTRVLGFPSVEALLNSVRRFLSSAT